MESGLIIGIVMGILGSISLNVGKGVQKMKVHILKHGLKVFRKEHRKDFLIWLVGVSMAIGATFFYTYALKFTDKSSLIASLSGVGLVGLVIFAWAVLKEPVGRREIISSLMIVTGTALVSYFNESLGRDQQYNTDVILYVGIAVVIVFATLTFIGLKVPKFHGVCFAIIAGACIGIAMILGDIALVKSGGSVIGQMKYFVTYCALFFGNSAFAITQVALYKGNAILVVPILNSFVILTSIIVEYFVFGSTFVAIQYVGVAIIVISVFLLMTGKAK